MPLLIVNCDETKLSQRFLVEKERFTVGRSRTSEVSIRDKSVSKVHLVIAKTQTGYAFEDLWSQNGVYLNDVRRGSGALKDGDVLRVGRVEIVFKLDSPPPAAPPAPAAPGTSLAPPFTVPEEKRVQAPAAGAPRLSRALRGLAIGALGIGLGLLAGALGSRWSGPGEAPGSPEAPPAEAVGDLGPAEPVEASRTEGDPDSAAIVDEPFDGQEGVDRIASAWLEDLERPYASAEESSRVLTRLCLDLLGRPPTRAEARDLLPLGHEERWRRLEKESAQAVPDDLRSLVKKFLDRTPTRNERRALESRRLLDALREKRRSDKIQCGEGLLITASAEYRSAERRRPRSLRQMARSLVVDLLDRMPEAAEALELGEALLDDDAAAAAVHVLVHADEASRALPAFAGTFGSGAGAAEGEARAWAEAEFTRFLLRAPRGDELKALLLELGRGIEGARRVRAALATSSAYRSY